MMDELCVCGPGKRLPNGECSFCTFFMSLEDERRSIRERLYSDLPDSDEYVTLEEYFDLDHTVPLPNTDDERLDEEALENTVPLDMQAGEER